METTVSAKGQVVVPKAMRDRLGLVPGSKLHCEVRDGVLVLLPQTSPHKRIRYVRNPDSGLTVVAESGEAKKVSSEQVRALLTDFP